MTWKQIHLYAGNPEIHRNACDYLYASLKAKSQQVHLIDSNLDFTQNWIGKPTIWIKTSADIAYKANQIIRNYSRIIGEPVSLDGIGPSMFVPRSSRSDQNYAAMRSMLKSLTKNAASRKTLSKSSVDPK